MFFFKEVIQGLKKIPTVSSRSAERIAFSLIKMNKKEVLSLLASIENFITKTSFCSVCGLLSEYNPCRICQSNKRDKTMICIIGEIEDAISIEKTNIYSGLYHVMGGMLSPINNVLKENLQVEKLLKRISIQVKEIIFAFEEGAEEDATIIFLKEKMKSYPLIFSRIQKGIQSKNENIVKTLIRERAFI